MDNEGKPQEFKRIPRGADNSDAPLSDSTSSPEDKASAEIADLTRGKPIRDLKQEKEEAEHDRDRKFRDMFEGMAILAFKGIFGALAVMGAVWVWHIVMPPKIAFPWGTWTCRWLSKEDLETIKGLLTGGALVVALGKHIEKRTN